MLQRFAIVITVLSLTLTARVHAQVVHFPDPNLRAAVAESIGVDPDHITRVALQRLTRLGVLNREIESLEGLQHAPNLRLLDLSGNPISDLTPLANLTNLEELLLHDNRISDISPIAGLINLVHLSIDHNAVTDISPLAGLTNLRHLTTQNNYIADHSPVNGLALDTFIYDQICDMPPEPLEPRLANRTFPSIFRAFSGQIVNIPDLHDRRVAMNAKPDIRLTGLPFGSRWLQIGDEWHVRG